MDALKAFIVSPVAVVLALAWLFIIAFGWHTKLWSIVVRRKAPERPSKEQLGIHNSGGQATSVVSALLEADKQHLSEFIHVFACGVEFSHLIDLDSYLYIWFDVWSASVGLVTIGEGISGRICYRDNLLPGVLQIEAKIQLRRGNSERLKLRQYVSNDIASDIMHRADSEMRLDFTGASSGVGKRVDIAMRCDLPDGNTSNASLPLPSSLVTPLPSVRELK